MRFRRQPELPRALHDVTSAQLDYFPQNAPMHSALSIRELALEALRQFTPVAKSFDDRSVERQYQAGNQIDHLAPKFFATI